MRTVVITGCSSGFGFEAALAFGRYGDAVYATMREMKRGTGLQDLAEKEGLDIHIKTLDVTQAETFPAVVEEIIEESGRIDVLVNNAGILQPGALEDQSIGEIKEVMDTNFYGPLVLTHTVLPYMRKQNTGYIINISSLSGIAGLPGDVTYAASKFAIEGAMEALRHEVDRWNIKIALVQAGLYATGIFKEDPQIRSALPQAYQENSPYRPLIEHQYKELMARLPNAADPRKLAELLITIAGSDGSQLRWPADDIAKKVLNTMFAQDDLERDTFLREISGTDWWSEGK